MNHESKRPVTVEDLIRLKRAERPPAEFWPQFDQELRAKQLAALVQKQAWWHRLPRAFATVARYRFPLGASAILAVTLMAVREYRPAGVVNGDPTFSSGAATISANAAVGAGSEGAGLATIGEETPGNYGAYEVRESEQLALADSTVNESSPARPSGGQSQTLALSGGPALLKAPELMPAGHSIASNPAAEPMVARGLLGAAHGFETRALPARAVTVEPLAQMATPSETRRARLQSAMAMMSVPDAPVRTGERVASQISDDRLYDQAHRLSGRGDRLSFKF
jgi:hypothetical protein